ncbi:MAG: exopolysaccharide Pel transporter PelG [Clostridium sp.]|nr:exopolysaccharide Pel transporter PelG [Acetatifactor muris]MCM1526256.1 exopolysaccharide Pel transporter PelG [Bacteroides sp.]MCM1562927.1 exopolysaccharide Pel transporter PelG [Clostridium sp.]
MAGIGVRLRKIYGQNTITTNLFGFSYSTVITIAPMFLVILAVIVMYRILGFSKVDYAARELYSCTVLYIFIFALLTASPFNAVLSRYMSDVIYRESFEDILACYYVGLLMNILLSCALGIPFCIWEYVVGRVALHYVLAGYCGYIALVLVFYSMLYLSICKDYKKISLFFMIGMVVTVLLSWVLVKWIHLETSFGMLVSMGVGFLLIAALEYALVRSYFRENSAKYREVLNYFKSNWQLVATNFLYNLGLFVHNFVFWTTDSHMVVAKSFVCMTSYDMATCIAMFTNISSTVIFISGVEMRFHDRYKQYSEAVIGGRGMDIRNAKERMFGQLAEELMQLVRIQFIVSVVLFMLCIVFMPQMGFGGLVMQIYPCLAAGYFILFTMYAAMIFLYYFNDLNGALCTAGSFVLVTLAVSIFATRLSPIWYGVGLIVGTLVGWSVAYARLRGMEKNLDIHIFCKGSIMKRGHGKRPSNRVYVRKRYPVGEKGE